MAYTQTDLIAGGIVFPTIGLLMVCLRFWMRRKYQNTYIGADDWCILIASILAIGVGVNAIIGSYVGLMGMDGLEIDHSRETPQKKVVYAVLIFEKPAYGTIKLSVLLFYRRIFSVSKFRTINNYLIALIVIWTAAFFLADFLACGAEVDANWDSQAETQAHCVNLFALLLCFAITDILTDVAVMWMPYPEIKRLHLPTRDKLALAGVFLLGTFDLFMGIVRLGFIIVNQMRTAVQGNLNKLDQTAPTFWTVAEVGVGVIAANLPALFPLFKDSAKLGSRLSSFLSSTLRFRRRGSVTRDLTATSATDMPRYSQMPSSNEIGAVGDSLRQQSHVGDTGRNQKHRSMNVGIWDQFERGDVAQVREDEHVQLPGRVVVRL